MTLFVLQCCRAPIDRNSAASRLGEEIGCWVLPLPKGTQALREAPAFEAWQKAIKYTPAEMLQGMKKLLKEAGLPHQEPELAKAIGEIFERECVLTEGAASRKLARDFEL